MQRTYFPQFNGLRFIAASSVLVAHILPYRQGGFLGVMGVNFFFVLSGFLVTWLLLEERKEKGKINIFFFYIRRILRIWPLYYLVCILGFFVYPLVFYQHDNTFYPGNDSWYKLITRYFLFIPNTVHQQIPYVTQLWSIGIEEQFYLLWPPVIAFFRKTGWVVFNLFVLLFFTLDVPLYFDLPGLSDFTSLTYLAVGSLGATWCYDQKKIISLITGKVISFLALGFVLIVFFTRVETKWMLLLLSASYLVIIANSALDEKTIFRLNRPVLHVLGSISYGIYMYQGVILDSWFIVSRYLPAIPSILILGYKTVYVFAGTIGTAYISYQFFEKPINGLKKKFS